MLSLLVSVLRTSLLVGCFVRACSIVLLCLLVVVTESVARLLVSGSGARLLGAGRSALCWRRTRAFLGDVLAEDCA